MCVSSGAAAEGTEVSDGGVEKGGGDGGVGNGGDGKQFTMGAGEYFCWCGDRMRLMRASSAGGAGTCDVEGCGGWVEREQLVYACTGHNDYACTECVPRAPRLTMDALIDECGMVETELEQFRQELGLGVSELEEAVVGDVTVGAMNGTERDEVVARRGLVAADWVAGRRRATRKVTGWLGGSKESGGLVDVERRGVEEVEEVDTLWVSSGDDLAPQSPNHAKEAAKEAVSAPQAHGHPADGTGLTAAARPETLKEAFSSNLF